MLIGVHICYTAFFVSQCTKKGEVTMTDSITEIYTERKRTYHDYECEDIVIMKKDYGCSWKDTIKLFHSRMYQGSVYHPKGNTSFAWDKILRNSHIIRFICPEIFMSDTTYQQIEQKINGIKVVLEFPTQPEQTDILHQEIKSILSSVLREQLQKIS